MAKPSSAKITTIIMKLMTSLLKKVAFLMKASVNTEHASSSVEAEERLPDYGACGRRPRGMGRAGGREPKLRYQTEMFDTRKPST